MKLNRQSRLSLYYLINVGWHGLLSVLLTLMAVSLVWAAPLGLVSVPVGGAVVQGRVDDGVERFLGIPYAIPPVGSHRWKVAQPALGHEGLLQAQTYGAACLQRLHPRRPKLELSEDCLTLNVWRPEKSQHKSMPVMVWIHGGGFTTGSGQIPGEVLAREGIIVVSLNYRLGALGFFAHPALKSSVANFGLSDATQALKWVHDNIADFGGDPANVTLFGVSAGGMMVNLLLASEQAEGLFQKAIAQSGYITWPLPVTEEEKAKAVRDIDGRTMATAEQEWQQRVKAVAPDATTADALRELNGQTLVAAVNGFARPIVDGVTIQDQPYRLAESRSREVPLITGGNSFEGSIMPYSGISVAQYQQSWAGQTEIFSDLYASDLRYDSNLAYSRAFGDERYLFSAYYLAQAWQSKATRVWLYYNDMPPSEQEPGAPHGIDKQLLFYPDSLPTDRVKKQGETLRNYWLNFARYGDPNGKQEEKWPPYRLSTRQWLTLSETQRTAVVKSETMQVLQQRLKARERLIQPYQRSGVLETSKGR